ncbi:MAG: orotidine-5'-phosphate decarboxylase [bacterium]
MRFIDKLLAASRGNDSLVCVGLDADLDSIPRSLLKSPNPIFDFNRAIIEATQDLVCAYKPNMAFYEVMGGEGIRVLERTIESVPSNIPVILDAKRGDVAPTSEKYAKFAFDVLGADAITVNPYMGRDSLEPFLRYEERGIFIICLTSNEGARDFEQMLCNGMPLYQRVAMRARDWNIRGNCGLVVGATHEDALPFFRYITPDMPILVPGIGAQGGNLEAVMAYCPDDNGERVIISSSRSIIYASRGSDFAEAAREAVIGLRRRINDLRRCRSRE